jgi:hypothetical protein
VSRPRSGLAVAALVVFGMGAADRSATAAVLYCRSPIVADAEHPTSERAARRLALQRWMRAAARLGPAWASWRLARPKAVSCAPLDGGGILCRAVAAPCALSQVPGRMPPVVPREEARRERYQPPAG